MLKIDKNIKNSPARDVLTMGYKSLGNVFLAERGKKVDHPFSECFFFVPLVYLCPEHGIIYTYQLNCEYGNSSYIKCSQFGLSILGNKWKNNV